MLPFDFIFSGSLPPPSPFFSLLFLLCLGIVKDQHHFPILLLFLSWLMPLSDFLQLLDLSDLFSSFVLFLWLLGLVDS